MTQVSRWGIQARTNPCLLAANSSQAFATRSRGFPGMNPWPTLFELRRKISRQPDCRNKSARINCEFSVSSAWTYFGNFRNEYTVITVANIGVRSMISGKRETLVSRVQQKHNEPHEENFHRVDGVFHVACWSFFRLQYLPNSVPVSNESASIPLSRPVDAANSLVLFLKG
jgi:hypothetical protein